MVIIVQSRLFCNDTATTGIYMYEHPLFLHDAVPFYLARRAARAGRPAAPRQPAGAAPAAAPRRRDPGAGRMPDRLPAHRRGAPRAARFPRSEENTSELQSLMRNSYAAFCLNKKNYIRAQPNGA